MTDTTIDPPASIPNVLHEEATDLVRELAGIAGSEASVTNKLRASLAKYDDKNALALVAAALIVVFSECITTPTEPGAYAETSLPTD